MKALLRQKRLRKQWKSGTCEASPWPTESAHKVIRPFLLSYLDRLPHVVGAGDIPVLGVWPEDERRVVVPALHGAPLVPGVMAPLVVPVMLLQGVLRHQLCRARLSFDNYRLALETR